MIINGYVTKRIPNCPGEYYASECGKIFNGKIGRQRQMKPGNQGNYYVFSAYEGGICNNVYFHRAIYEAWKGPIPANMVVDHENRDKLDNRSSNLRLGTRTQNSQNNNAKGYNWDAVASNWRAYINIAGKQVVKCFKREADAIAWRAQKVAIHYPYVTV